MTENTKQEAALRNKSLSVLANINAVEGFDPHMVTACYQNTEGNGRMYLQAEFSMLWFRLKYPNGRIKLSSLKITDQLAIIEARVYFDKNDAQPRSSFIAQREAKATLGGLYIESAQHAAIDQALSDAGFGVQFSAAAPAVNAEKAAETVKEQTTVAETATTEQVTPAAPVTVAEVATEVNNEPAQEALAVQETVAEVPTAEVMEPLAPVTEEAEGEEIEEETADTDTAAPTYSADMPVDAICSMMTYEEAGNVIVPLGTCKGWAMSQVADRRPASLKWYINGYSGNDNILRAAATIMQASLDEMQRAS